jgi:trimethylamine--corrinoid protein Co-methyltransferase
VTDALPNIDFAMSFALASDVPKGCEDVHHFAGMLLNTTKPLLFTAWDLDGIAAIYQMACLASGSEEKFQNRPFICHYIEPVTPLRHPKESLDKLVFSIEKGIPVMYVPVSSAGGTTPVTFAGSFAITNAEFLAGLVVSQLIRKGSTLIYGGGPNPLDLRTAVLPYASPETFMSRCIRAEIARFYGLPCFSTGGTSDAKVLDAQAGYEAGTSLMLAALSGCSFIHDIGYMEMGYTSSLELLTMCDEFISMIKRILRGFSVSKDTLALDVIHAAGPGGNFLQNPHTFEHFRQEIWVSELLDRQIYSQWSDKGAQDLRQRANEKVRSILKNHQITALPQDVASAIKDIVQATDRKRSN